MSAATIARWNAISLSGERPLKRSRSISDDEEDNVSLVSRSPSPVSIPMEVDPYKYDEYVSRPAAPETITVESRIKPTNKGFAMLARLGWREGEPLGLSPEGRVDPVPFHMKQDSLGLGRLTQDIRMIETTVSQRRDMDSERMSRESDEQRKAREVSLSIDQRHNLLTCIKDNVARRSALETQLSSTIKAFHCELCDKQFKNIAAYTEHTNSYAHHHKARFKDMQSSMRGTQDEAEKRKEKERKREEKEMRKMAAAKGIKLIKPTTVVPSSSGPSHSDMDIDGEPIITEPTPQSGFKASGWTTVASSSEPPNPATTTPTPAAPPPPPPSEPPLPPPITTHPIPPPVSAAEQPTGKAHASRLGWQQFQKKRR
ncbi:hypothetical protein MIND_00462600 [Mycena indigotica]|uniref:G-patch domain-containing protein n=1 Tax=Mycena indigotica TaxID=2126181 RepID=A0A8H6SWL7_9AGAR|nr:uncharacterized protein MIND_00462600 [Mycena indigotica]KAF7306709.1 hypothetical protein MIND_00462600 [Mycena indigotica]